MFEEIKQACKDKNSDTTSVVDDVHGAENISNHFKNIYEQLYNEQGDISDDVINKIRDKVENEAVEAKNTIALITADLVKTAVKKLKPDQSAVSGNFSSDCLKAAPSIFFEKLSALFRAYLLHGYISHDLLVCALSPLVKDPNGDISSSKNYRGLQSHLLY